MINLCWLSAVLAAVLVRNLCSKSESVGAAENGKKFGWRLLHADVFRTPRVSPMLLAVCTGTGAQLVCTALIVACAAFLGYMSPAQRGYLLLGILSVFSLSGVLNGYIATRLYMTFKGTRLNNLAVATSLGFPGLAFCILLLVNLMAFFHGSTLAAPLHAICTLFFGCLGILPPLVFGGTYLGRLRGPLEFPVTTSKIPRQIPRQPWYTNMLFDLAICGLLSFAVIFVELYYMMTAVWKGYYYYVYGFLLLAALIMILTCAEASILFTCHRFNNEDYCWWWRSFCNGGSLAIYVLFYSIVYYQRLVVSPCSLTSHLMYFGYMGLLSIALFTMFGFIGLSASLWFSMKLFSSISIHCQ
jgi:transmembrane 9 superfamily member 2/4